MNLPTVAPNTVFLNIPYDQRFKPLYMAYVVGLAELGLEPRATLDIPGGERRLNRIVSLIRNCRYSIHDLSRVELDRKKPSTPRFNMPCELGLTIACDILEPNRHSWFLFESMHRRVSKSLSDLDGTDAYIHDGTVEGVMRELCAAFVRTSVPGPSVPAMLVNYRKTARQVPELLRRAGTSNVFNARVFTDLCFLAKVNAERVGGTA